MSVTQPARPIRLYRFALSGHAHRVQLFLSLLGLPVELVDVDLTTGAHKKPDFLAINPFGQVPAIVDGDVTLADSNAILVYLATKYDDGNWLPREPQAAATVQRFLSIAAGEISGGPAKARVLNLFKLDTDPAPFRAIANNLFKLMDAHLAAQPFLAGARPTIADVACYTYIAHAPEGGISLAEYGNLRAWLSRIEALPGFVPMPSTKIGLAA